MRDVKLKSLTTGVIGVMFAGGAAAGTVTSDGADIVIKTNSGFEAKTVDGDYKFKLGGRVMVDADRMDGVFTETGAAGEGGRRNATEIRRARIELKGTAKKDWHYGLSADLDEGGDTGIDIAYLKYTGLSLADVTVGRVKTPVGLENLTSSKWISTIERSMIWDATNVDSKKRQVQLNGNFADQVTWSAALVDTGDESGDNESAVIGGSGRLTWSPIHDGNQTVHLGVSYSSSDAKGTSRKAESRFAVHTAEKAPLFDEAVDDDATLGLEAAYAMGPLSIQGELIQREADVSGTSRSIEVDGYYVQVAYTLTGEPRAYKWKSGKFDKIKPKGPNGAVELVAKYESLEVDEDIAGSEAKEADLTTLGINWYPIQNVKLMLNYLDVGTDNIRTGAGDEESGDAFAMRAQYAF